MKKFDWRTLFEGVGVIAIVLSLIFVGLQLRQDQILVRSELGAGSAELNVHHRMMAIESSFQKTFAKMMTQPGQMTDEEVIEADLFLTSLTQMIVRECYLVERGVFVECEAMAYVLLRNFFENQFAKNWWQGRIESGRLNPYLPDWISDVVADLDPNGNRRRIDQLRQSFE